MTADRPSFLIIGNRKQLKMYLEPETSSSLRVNMTSSGIIERAAASVVGWKPGAGRSIFLIQSRDPAFRASTAYILGKRLLSLGYRIITVDGEGYGNGSLPDSGEKTVLLLNTGSEGRSRDGDVDPDRKLLNSIRMGSSDEYWSLMPAIALSDATADPDIAESVPDISGEGRLPLKRSSMALFSMGFLAMALPLLIRGLSGFPLIPELEAHISVYGSAFLPHSFSTIFPYLLSSIPGITGILLVLLSGKSVDAGKYKAFGIGAAIWLTGTVIAPFLTSSLLENEFGTHVSILTPMVGFLLIPQIMAFASYPMISGPFLGKRGKRSVTAATALYIIFGEMGIYALSLDSTLKSFTPPWHSPSGSQDEPGYQPGSAPSTPSGAIRRLRICRRSWSKERT